VCNANWRAIEKQPHLDFRRMRTVTLLVNHE
jgi:hypothetical protein